MDLRSERDAKTIKFIESLRNSSNGELVPTIDKGLEELFPSRISAAKTNKEANTVRPTEHYGRRAKITGTRSALYKKAQQMYCKNTRTLAHSIIDNTLTAPEDNSTPSPEDVLNHLRTTFSHSTNQTPDDDHRRERSSENGTPLSEEIATTKTNWKRSAPRPDGTLVQQVLSTNNKTPAILYNCIMASQILPSRFREVRSILLHKSGDRTDPKNWRLISIFSAIRLHHRALAHRLRSVLTPNTNQRGFCNVDGTLANITILEAFIKERKRLNKTVTVLFLDVSQAFDRVDHRAVKGALRDQKPGRRNTGLHRTIHDGHND